MWTLTLRLSCIAMLIGTLGGLASLSGCDDILPNPGDILTPDDPNDPGDITLPPPTPIEPPVVAENITYDKGYEVRTILEDRTVLPVGGLIGITDDQVRIHGVNDQGQILFSYVSLDSTGAAGPARLLFYEGPASNTLVEFDSRRTDGRTYDFAILGEAGNFVWLGPDGDKSALLRYGRLADRSFIDLSTTKVAPEHLGLNGMGQLVWAESANKFANGPMKYFDGQYLYELGTSGQRPRLNNSGQLVWYVHGQGLMQGSIDEVGQLKDSRLAVSGRFDIYSLSDDYVAIAKDHSDLSIHAYMLNESLRQTLYAGSLMTAPGVISRQGQFLVRDTEGHWRFYMLNRGIVDIGEANPSQGQAVSDGAYAAYNHKITKDLIVYDGVETFPLAVVGKEKLPTVAEDQQMVAISRNGSVAWVELTATDREAGTAWFRVRLGTPLE